MMSKSHSLINRLATFLGDPVLTKQDNDSPSITQLKKLVEIHTLAQMLPYDSYDSTTGLYTNQRSVGFMLLLSPLNGADSTIADTFNSLITEKIPAGSFVQLSTWASPKIAPKLDSSDGKVGVKGTLYMNAGKLVSNAFFAGVLSGMGNGVSQQYTTSTLSPLGQTTTLDPSRSLQYGLSSGVGEAGNRMSDYFIRRADQYNPVVQVPPQAVDIIFIKEGIWLDDDIQPSSAENSNNVIDQSARLNTEIQQATNLFNQY